MQRCSFVPIVRSVTPPPTSEPPGMLDGPSATTPDGPWTVTAEDLSSGPRKHTPDYGAVFITFWNFLLTTELTQGRFRGFFSPIFTIPTVIT